MPTRLGQATFEALVEARSRFNEISIKLADPSNHADTPARREPQQQWNDAFGRLEVTTKRFCAIVQEFGYEIVKGNRAKL